MRSLRLMILGAIASFVMSATSAHAICNARFLNPITEVCWDCIFPISVGAMSVNLGQHRPDTANKAFPLCVCPGFPLPRIGLSIGVWEPARLIDVSNETGCFANLGFDVDFGLFSRGNTTANSRAGGDNGSAWHAHYYYYPLISMMGTAIDALCLETTAFDLAWMSEIDPLWMDPELTTLLNPESLLFANPVAQTACAADCAVASSGQLPLDQLFWCDGCSGPLYPVTGYANNHVGGVQASSVVSAKVLARMHRMLLAMKTSGSTNAELCGPSIAPIIPRSQYRRQITRPFPKTTGRFAGAPLGASTQFYDTNREVPYVGESFGYLIWRKRNCCAL